MRIERWFWLPIFCIVSLIVHLTAVVVTHVPAPPIRLADSAGIEVSFEPAVIPPLPKPEPKIVPPKPHPSVVRGPKPAALTPYHVAIVRHVAKAERAERPNPAPNVGLSPTAPVRRAASATELPERILAEAPGATVHDAASTAPPVAIHIPRSDPRIQEGGGSPSPAPVPGGHGGLNAPETPKEDILYTGGGRGGENLPAAAPRIGGGGGRSILSVNRANPLGDTLPDDKPGIGPGIGGGLGKGSGGGIGYASGKGIGTRADGKVAIGSLRRKPGSGIGAALAGSEVGTKPPGGGHGRGAELPGAGGTGAGYGRGHGTGIGDGVDDASPPPRMRGVPFGNVAGLLGGGDGGPRGLPGRGAVFVPRQVGGGGGPIHIVYALDVSGSMREGNKIGKAKEALKKALGELRRTDTFNIIVFKRDASTFRDDSVPAIPANIANARAFVDEIRIGDGTNISGALDLAFGMNGITHIYLMSDGEPNGGISDFAELRRFVRAKNTRGIKVTTLALGLGENFPGMRLLKGIAEDNNGSYDYVNLSRIASPQ
jgi:hypothetical protein